MKQGGPHESEGFGTHRELYTALLRRGIKGDQALLAALDVLTNIQNQSPYTCYGEGYTIVAEAC
ncbi:hypothetical protein C8J32_10640 [Rhizobium sp. PP-CC-3A-592]|nr:hypothetical protein C8J32_10640 [Rhizobium sp. PP-CC-3A-592]